jgi:hypothetical protein
MTIIHNFVFSFLIIQQAMRMRHIVLFGVKHFTLLSHIIG